MMSDREYLGLGRGRSGRDKPRYQDETKLGNAAVTSRDGLSGHCSLQDASQFSGSHLGILGGGSRGS